MNQKQKEYAISRVQGIVSSRIKNYSDTLPRIHYPALTLGEFVKLLKSGKIKPRPSCEDKYISRSNIVESFELGKYHCTASNYDRPEYTKADQRKLGNFRESMKCKASTIIDEIMLGDEKEALQLLRDFESGK